MTSYTTFLVAKALLICCVETYWDEIFGFNSPVNVFAWTSAGWLWTIHGLSASYLWPSLWLVISMDIPMVHGLSWAAGSWYPKVNSVMLGVESQMSLDHRDIAWSKCFVCISADEKLWKERKCHEGWTGTIHCYFWRVVKLNTLGGESCFVNTFHRSHAQRQSAEDCRNLLFDYFHLCRLPHFCFTLMVRGCSSPSASGLPLVPSATRNVGWLLRTVVVYTVRFLSSRMAMGQTSSSTVKGSAFLRRFYSDWLLTDRTLA